MPNMDGLSFVREVKKNAAYKFVPIVMLTTESADSLKSEGQAAGLKAWMLKPFKPDQMIAVVNKLINWGGLPIGARKEFASDRRHYISVAVTQENVFDGCDQ